MAQATFTHEGEKMKSFKLLSGHDIPAVGIGTWKCDSQAEHSVSTALIEVPYLSTHPCLFILSLVFFFGYFYVWYFMGLNLYSQYFVLVANSNGGIHFVILFIFFSRVVSQNKGKRNKFELPNFSFVLASLFTAKC